MRAAVIAGTVVMLAAGGARAQDVPAHKNAAQQYWIAFEFLPNYANLPKEQQALLDEWETVPFTPENIETLRKWQTPLKYLHRGAESENCVWPSAANFSRDGIDTYSPTHHARELAVLGLLRARYRFEHGRPEAAFDDVLAVLRLARHVGREGGMIPLVIERAIENLVIRCVAGNIGAVPDREVWRAFLRRWDTAPKPTTLPVALAAERDRLIAWFNTRGVDVGSDVEPDLEGNPPRRDRSDRVATTKYLLWLQSERGSVREFVTAINREYGRAIEIARLPLEKAEAANAEWRKALESNAAGDDRIVHVFVGLAAPDVYKLRLGEERMTALRVMFRAAVTDAADGAELGTSGRDPFGNGPFEVTKTPTGYELRSKLDELLTEAEQKNREKFGRAVLAVRTTRPGQ